MTQEERDTRSTHTLTSISSLSSSTFAHSPHEPRRIPQEDVEPKPFIKEDDDDDDDHRPFKDDYYNDDLDSDIVNAYYPDGDERNLYSTVIKEEPHRKKSLYRKFYEAAYPRYIINHLDYNSFKVVFRSWAHIWSGIILTIVPLTATWLGSANYLTQIVTFIIISGGNSMIANIIQGVSFFSGALIAFVHHVVRSKIINDLHGGITAEQLTQNLINEGSCQPGPTLEDCIQKQIYSGRYITTKTVAISALSMITCMFILGNIRQRVHPLMMSGYIGGSIGNVIFTCYGHFSPLYEPLTIGVSVLIPMGASIMLKLGCSFFIFPTTSNHDYFKGLQGSLNNLRAICKKNMKLYNTLKPSAPNFTNYKAFKGDITKLRGAMAPLEIIASTIWLELSYGRFDTGDVGEFRSLYKNLISATASFGYFYQLLQERSFFARDDFAITRRKSTTSSHLEHGHAKLFSAFQDSYKKVGEFEMRRRMKILRKRIMHHGNGHRININDIDNIARFITKTFNPLLDASEIGMEALAEWLTYANEFRISAWLPGQWKKCINQQQKANEKLRNAKSEIMKIKDSFDNIEKLKDAMFHDSRNEDSLLFLISQGILFLQISKHQLDNLIKLIDFALDLDERRPTPQFITFFTKTKFAKPKHLSSDIDGDIPDYLQSTIQRRDADNLPPSNVIQVLGFHSLKVVRYFMSDNFWFWIRAGGLLVIGAIPYFVRTTAEWYYNSRMVWLCIMIAVSVSENTGQTVYNCCARIIYSFFGCLAGMVAWYISTGNGNGNDYGYGAVTAVVFAYLAYFRHFSIHSTPAPGILLGITTNLVLGTSWLDTHGNKAANVGKGFTPAWIRFVSVCIGLAIGCLLTFVPTPKSSKHILRKSLGSLLSEVGNLHCDVSKFALRRSQDAKITIQARHDILLAKFRFLFMKIASLSKLIVPLQFELPISGYWPESKYHRLQGLLSDVSQLYFMLLLAFNELQDPETWIPIIIKRVGFCYADLDAEIFSTIHMASNALMTKDALPKITEANVSVRHMEYLRGQWGLNRISLSERFYNEEKFQSENSIIDHLDFQKFFSNDGQLNILSLLVAHMIYNRIDEIMIVVKGLVGELYDFDENILLDDMDKDLEDSENDALLND
ncbi:unnamed protein product [Candida verbasci]|uniref:ER transporter 6TM N-terminal domain-containing protein n=1 Tax=Candida verbasci TaxID=1227364 RepID=A0A9W4TUU7_9ASCO|nr:unnamed protein product [Candida verbasci]